LFLGGGRAVLDGKIQDVGSARTHKGRVEEGVDLSLIKKKTGRKGGVDFSDESNPGSPVERLNVIATKS